MNADLILPALLGAALFGSGLFSAVETVYLTLDRIRYAARAHQGDKVALLLESADRERTRFFTTVLFANTLANATFASLFALVFTAYGLSAQTILILSPLINLIIGETIPKVLARQSADHLARAALIAYRGTYLATVPIVMAMLYLVEVIRRRLGTPQDEVWFLSRSDLTGTLSDAGQSGLLEPKEVTMLHRSLRLSELRVFDLMTPRTALTAAPVTATVADLRQLMATSPFKRIVIYGRDLDDPLGIVQTSDLLTLDNGGDTAELSSILKPLATVPESLPVLRLTGALREQNARLAGVIDEYGGLAGVVSIEDLAEELVGPIAEETRSPGPGCLRLTDRTYLIDSRVRLSHLGTYIPLVLPDSEAVSVGGWMVELAGGDIPDAGQEFRIPGATLRVIGADPRGVKRVRLTLERHSSLPDREGRRPAKA
ncbi:MAG: HlyC/CorC family transporter [Calditrichaeota bacterium]|nr:HlyC/CorC family transporter [Calditrichota bacterium]